MQLSLLAMALRPRGCSTKRTLAGTDLVQMQGGRPGSTCTILATWRSLALLGHFGPEFSNLNYWNGTTMLSLQQKGYVLVTFFSDSLLCSSLLFSVLIVECGLLSCWRGLYCHGEPSAQTPDTFLMVACVYCRTSCEHVVYSSHGLGDCFGGRCDPADHSDQC